jgi:predicted nucleotidyltransferase/uncharacterized protein (UPF0332 family)
MEFKIQEKGIDHTKYPKSDMDLAYKFSKQIHEEFGDLVKAVVLFGSHSKNVQKKSSDIDLMIIIDDVTVEFAQELVEAYRIIVEKLVLEVSERLHITSLKLTSFWDYMRKGDPVGLNILREGIPLLDSGFFSPAKALLQRGQIRPSIEAVYTYFSRAPNTLNNARWHLMQGCIDLYWSVVDSAHAALMSIDQMPPSPEHISDLLIEKLVKPGELNKKYSHTVDKFFRLYKSITKKELKAISGKEFDKLYSEAYDFVKVMREFINKYGLKK